MLLPVAEPSEGAHTLPAPGSETARTAYLAAEGFEAELDTDLADAGLSVSLAHGRLRLTESAPVPMPWAQNIWFDPVLLPAPSIAQAAAALRGLARNWVCYGAGHHRRAALIAEKLPHVSARPLHFGAPAPQAPLGSWTLLDAATLLAAPRCASPFPHGEAQFVEDREGPPSRAYLKLWEVFTLTGQRPAPGALCVDLGASPGGWSFVLASLGGRVRAVDKAPLDPKVLALPGVTALTESAFALDPGQFLQQHGPADWLCCDVICYPERLLGMLRRWLAAGAARRIIATVKFQGATDHAIQREFAAIAGGRLIHLAHNKHELTFLFGI